MKLKEDTYMEKPKDFEMKGNEDKLYRQSKPQYSLKRPPAMIFDIMSRYN